MFDQSKVSELIRFAGIDAGSTVIDVYPGDGDWTRLFSDIVGPEGRVYSFVPGEALAGHGADFMLTSACGAKQVRRRRFRGGGLSA